MNTHNTSGTIPATTPNTRPLRSQRKPASVDLRQTLRSLYDSGADIGSLYRNDEGFWELTKALSKAIQDSTLEKLARSGHFGLMIDETVDITNKKNLII